VLGQVADRIGVPHLALVPGSPPDGLTAFERLASRWLRLDRYAGLAGAADTPSIVDGVVAVGFDRYRSATDVVAPDGARLRAYAAGDPSAEPVVLASACGMPAKLSDRWFALLSRDHYVITWESRGLFGDVPDFDALGWDTAAQVADLVAVMDHYGVPRAHLMGFCGGSVLALATAAWHPERASSLSLWHGAYELGPGCRKTDHHRNMQALMAMAAESRDTAAGVHSVFLHTMLTGAPPNMAHLVLYPYATPELLYRYCRVNGAITDIDVSGLLPLVEQPALVVTSEDDCTAEPEGSLRVAEALPDATLRVQPHGDHISLFTMGGELGAVANGFLRERASAGSRH
jgi:3-oxoadipate enol-lactonase